MFKKVFSLLILTLFMISLVSLQANAKSRYENPREQYSFTVQKKALALKGDESPIINKTDVRQSLGVTGDGNTPGELIAHTWYEWQANSSYGRGIDWRGAQPQIHMSYTQMFAENGRRYSSYNVYDPVSGTWPKTADIGCPVAPPAGAAEGRSGFTNTDARPQGGAVIACHYRLTDVASDNYSTYVFYDATAPAIWCGFGTGSEAPNKLAQHDGLETNPEYIWPKLEYHINGVDTAIYAFSCEAVDNAALQTLVLFRNVGSSLLNDWEAYVIDTAFFILQDLTASRVSRKVAVKS